MKKSPIIFVLVPLLVSCASRESDVRVYSVAKAIAPAMSVAASGAPPSGAPAQSGSGWKWESPSGWKELPGNDIRLASFEVKSKKGSGDASIVVLGGDAGGLEANVNRWRQQAGLAPEGAEAILKESKAGKAKIGEYRLFEMKGTGGKPSILAAVFSLPGKTLFVKLSAKQEMLDSQRASFAALCQSIRN